MPATADSDALDARCDWQQLADAFEPPALLRNPHLQNISSSVGARRWQSLRHSRSWRVRTQPVLLDGGDGVRLLACYDRPAQPPHGLVVLLPGWEGHNDSPYMLSAVTRLLAAGYSCLRINFRDHGHSLHLNRMPFHSARLAETYQAVADGLRRFGEARQWLVGFSLGGNFGLRILAEPGAEALQLAGFCAICPVIDPADTTAILDRGPLIYRDYFLRKWRRSLRLKLHYFPDLPYSAEEVGQFNRIAEMNKHFIGCYTEFARVEDYYAAYTLAPDILQRVAAPSLVIASEDDPIVPWHQLQRLQPGAQGKVVGTRHGSHCAFIENLNFDSWLDRQLLRFLTQGL